MTTPLLVAGATTLEAWQVGAAAIASTPKAEVFSLVTSIGDSTVEDRPSLSRFDSSTVGGKDTVYGVAAVLFPLLQQSPDEVPGHFLDRCSRVLARARARGLLRGGWGTYFDRLRGMDGADCQILRAIHAYKNWRISPKAAVVMHVSTPTIDHLRVMGSPCLQYVEITRPADRTLDLFAVYRNHDFVDKALGNFVGLARLLRFVCRNTGYVPGSIVCHSAHAYGQKRKLKDLLAR